MTKTIFHIDRVVPTERLVAETRQIIATSNAVIRSWNGSDEPEIGMDLIAFNGDDATDQAEDIFAIGDNEDTEGSIDTAGADYTEVVAAILVGAVLDHNGNVGFTGSRTVLTEGINLYEKAVSELTREEKKFVLTSIVKGAPVV